jgi:hypothetical protein
MVNGSYVQRNESTHRRRAYCGSISVCKCRLNIVLWVTITQNVPDVRSEYVTIESSRLNLQWWSRYEGTDTTNKAADIVVEPNA